MSFEGIRGGEWMVGEDSRWEERVGKEGEGE